MKIRFKLYFSIPVGYPKITPDQVVRIRAEADGKIQQLEHTVQTLLALPAPESGHD